MKKLLIAILLLPLSACVTAPAPLPPEQLLQQFCTSASIINSALLTTPGIDPKVIDNLNKAKPYVDAVCKNGAVLTSDNLNSLLSNGVPLLNVAIAALPPATPNLAAIKLGVGVAEVVIPQVVENLKATQQNIGK